MITVVPSVLEVSALSTLAGYLIGCKAGVFIERRFPKRRR